MQVELARINYDTSVKQLHFTFLRKTTLRLKALPYNFCQVKIKISLSFLFRHKRSSLIFTFRVHSHLFSETVPDHQE